MSAQDRQPARPRTALSAAQVEALWSPQRDESVLWQGKPDARVLARSAFRSPWIAGYFVALALWALAEGSAGGALATLGAGLCVLALVYALALISARTTSYILTDRRIILHIGMAIEKTVNLPLGRIGAARLNDRSNGFGEIALEPAGEHTLGYLLLWPHARPWHFAHPQPMLRGLPQAAMVAERLAEAVAAHQAIARAEEAPPPAPGRVRPTLEGAFA
ncbi:photosynthetic complex putative assembly protein PuhB [Alteriqipengyuania sp. 357]